MSRAQEASFLRAVLRRVQHGPGFPFAQVWSSVLVWLALVAVSVVAFAVVQIVPPVGVAALFFVLGGVYVYIAFRFTAARNWPILARYISRQAVEARLSELGSNYSVNRTQTR